MRLLPLSFALISSPLAAQTAPCINFNDANNMTTGGTTAFAFAGPTTWAHQFATPLPCTVRSGRLFTGNTLIAGSMCLEIWDHDNSNNQPGQRLATGAMKFNMAAAADWVGCNFDTAVLLNPANLYWLFWIEGGGSVLPHDPSGSATTFPQLSRIGYSGPWTPRAPVPLKFRLYQTLLDSSGVAVIGDGCGGRVGTAFTNDAAMTGNADFRIEGTNFPIGQPAVLVLGMIQGFPSLPFPGPPGCLLHTDIVLALPGMTGTGSHRDRIAFAGNIVYPLPLPGQGIRGRYAGFQIGVFDPGAMVPIPFLTSNGLAVTFR